ncbi:MAG: SWIM zinc finger family protein [Candidatus Bathyarchaeia archaeon]
MAQAEAAVIKDPQRFNAKVARLILENRLFQLCPSLYVVSGLHARYRVAFKNGRWQCSCPGFQQSGTCTHAEAVSKIDSLRRQAYSKPFRESL